MYRLDTPLHPRGDASNASNASKGDYGKWLKWGDMGAIYYLFIYLLVSMEASPLFSGGFLEASRFLGSFVITRGSGCFLEALEALEAS